MVQLCALGFQQHFQNFGVDGVILGAEELHAGQGRGFFCFLRQSLHLLRTIRLRINRKFQHDLKAGTPAGALSTLMEPPIRSTMLLVMAMPRPVPCTLLVPDLPPG